MTGTSMDVSDVFGPTQIATLTAAITTNMATALIAVLVIAIPVGYAMWMYNKARRPHKA